MKKYFISLLLMGVSVSVFAQLAVNSNGNVQIKDGSPGGNANLIVSDAPYLGYISDNINANVGTRSQGYATTANKSSIGLLGEGFIQNSTGASIGVWGEAYGAPSKNFGVVGMMDMSNTGAGIYATTESSLNYFTPGCYAAYFVDETYIDVNLTALSMYNLSDMRLKKIDNKKMVITK